MSITDNTSISEEIVLKQLSKVVTSYDSESATRRDAMARAVAMHIDVPAAMGAMQTESAKRVFATIVKTARRFMDLNEITPAGARVLLKTPIETVRVPFWFKKFRSRYARSGWLRHSVVEGLKITLDTRHLANPALDVKELIAMSNRLKGGVKTGVMKRAKDTTPDPALTVMADAEAALEDSRMPLARGSVEKPGDKPVMPEVDLEKSTAGVDLVEAMVDQAVKDINECLAPSSMRIDYSRGLLAKIKKLLGSVDVAKRELKNINPPVDVGQVWEDAGGKRFIVSVYNSQSEDYMILVELSPPYKANWIRGGGGDSISDTMVFLGVTDIVFGSRAVV